GETIAATAHPLVSGVPVASVDMQDIPQARDMHKAAQFMDAMELVCGSMSAQGSLRKRDTEGADSQRSVPATTVASDAPTRPATVGSCRQGPCPPVRAGHVTRRADSDHRSLRLRMDRPARALRGRLRAADGRPPRTPPRRRPELRYRCPPPRSAGLGS